LLDELFRDEEKMPGRDAELVQLEIENESKSVSAKSKIRCHELTHQYREAFASVILVLLDCVLCYE
jgi:hypothetical protein